MSGQRLHYHVAVLLAAITSPPTSFAEECPPARIRVAPSYQSPRGFEYAPREELRKKSSAKGEPIGIIEAVVGWDVEVGIQSRCVGAECQLCVDRIEGQAGFGPGRMRVAASLRGDPCRTDAVLAHEIKHSRVFDESTRLGVKRLIETLRRWAERQRTLVATREEVDAAAKARYDEIGRMMEEGVSWIEQRAGARNEQLDSPQRYEGELESMERRCELGSQR